MGRVSDVVRGTNLNVLEERDENYAKGDISLLVSKLRLKIEISLITGHT
jgi:hypothetical protein